jgi:HK97 family phage major capsid protein
MKDTNVDENEVVEAVEELKSSALGQIKGLSTQLEKLEASNKALEESVGELQKGALFSGGGSSGQRSFMSPEQKTAINRAFSALFKGDVRSADAFFAEAKGMSAGSSPDGGYVVLDQVSDTMTKVLPEISPLSGLARTITMNTGLAFEEPIDRDTAAAQWVGETTPRTDTATPQLGMFRVELKELCAMPSATQTLIDASYIDVMSWLTGKITDAFGMAEGDAFHNGDGVAKPRGILTYPTAATADATRAWGTVQYIASGADGAFPTPTTSVNPADCLQTTIGALKRQYRNGAVWLMNRNAAAAVGKLKDAQGRWVWVDSLVQGQPATLLGYPVEIDEDMPDIGSGKLAIAFGNFQRAYTIVRRPGLKFLPDPYTNKPYVRLYTWQRVGGEMNNSEAYKLVKFSDS